MDGPLLFALSLFASAIGSICGVGGGIIIKPLLDALHVMSVNTVSFLSGCTVLSMSIVSVFRTMRGGGVKIELGTSTPLAVGAVAGGLSGQWIFQTLLSRLPHIEHVGALQSLALFLSLLGLLLYTIYKDTIRTHRMKSVVLCLVSGTFLGLISSFIGIGGGPINLVVLSFFFSMDTKQAAANSLYIVMFSQIASTLHIVLGNSVPSFDPATLSLMVAGGIGGALIGGAVNKNISSAAVRKLFIGLMSVVICMSVYNLFLFITA